jgi:hypothetical protein
MVDIDLIQFSFQAAIMPNSRDKLVGKKIVVVGGTSGKIIAHSTASFFVADESKASAMALL